LGNTHHITVLRLSARGNYERHTTYSARVNASVRSLFFAEREKGVQPAAGVAQTLFADAFQIALHRRRLGQFN